MKKYGFGSEEPYTFNQMWKQTLQHFSSHQAINFETLPNQWVSWTYQEYYQHCTTFAKALISLKITNYSAINIIGFNSPEWAVAFSGSIFGNFLPIGIYTTNGSDACEYIANHSEA